MKALMFVMEVLSIGYNAAKIFSGQKAASWELKARFN